MQRFTTYRWPGDIEADSCTEGPPRGRAYVRDVRPGEVDDFALPHGAFSNAHGTTEAWRQFEIVRHTAGTVRPVHFNTDPAERGTRQSLSAFLARPARSPLSAGDAVRLQRRTMYIEYIVRRTQIYLTEAQGRLLKGRSQATGSTVSELIRSAIDDAYAPRRKLSTADRVHVAWRTAGAWKEFPETGAEYVERIRGSKRLSSMTRR